MGCLNCCFRHGYFFNVQIPLEKSPEQREGIPLLVEGFPEDWDFDEPLFTHGNGIASMLEALQANGVRTLFEPLVNEFDQVLRETKSHEYEPVLDSPDLKIAERRNEESGLLVMKVLNIVPGATVDKLCRLIQDPTLREGWESKHSSSGVTVSVVHVENKEDETHLFQYPGVLFSKGREFLDRRITYRHSSGQLVVTLSGAGVVDCPVNKKYIRGTTMFQLDVWYAIPGGAARYLCILADPKGTLPQSVVNYVSKTGPKKWHKNLLKAYADIAKECV